MTTIYDIAKIANVSPMTVSRVINKNRNVSEQTRKKVEKVIEELNYLPNFSARQLNTKKTNILSLIITDITNPFFTKVARGAEDKAMQMGYQVLLCNSDEDFQKESSYINTLISTRVSGVLITPTGDQSKKNLQTLSKHNIPFVLIDREIDGIECDEIHGDSIEGTRMILEHLISLGHKNIALINGPLNISTARKRQKSYIDTLKLNSLPVHQELILQSRYNQEDPVEAISSLLSLPDSKRPTAIFAANNFIAINTIKTLRKYKLRVPEDIAVVCFDDLGPNTEINPFLTVVSQPAYDFGYTGTQLLIERIEGIAPATFRKIVLPSQTIIRSSSKC